MKRYKRNIDTYIHNIGRFTEAVIHVGKYVDILDDELKQLKRELVSFKGDTLQLFNEKFYSYKIQFILMDDVYKDTYSFIKGNTNKDIITIYVTNDFYFYTSKDGLDVFKEFKKQLLLLLTHELVHRGQYYRRKGDLINFYNFDGDDDIDIEYLKNNQEIMAYALMYIESLRYSGITNNQIIDTMRTGKMIKSFSLHINFYIDKMKEHDIQIYKRFIKYIYEYLENPIKNDLKII